MNPFSIAMLASSSWAPSNSSLLIACLGGKPQTVKNLSFEVRVVLEKSQ